MAKKWRCTVCGYIHEGPEAPDQCPMCKVGKEKFVEVEERAGGLDFVTEHKLGDGKGASQELWEGLNNHFMGECSEVGQYLAMARQADREGYPEIAEAFRQIATVESEHERRYLKLLSRLTDGNFFHRDGEIWWQCRNCGYVCKATDAPKVCPACKHPQAYFEPKKENY